MTDFKVKNRNKRNSQELMSFLKKIKKEKDIEVDF